MPLRIGHRGAAGTHPENTMVSFRRAVELGCHGIEFDVHRTADGHLVVIHDETLDRTTTGTGYIMGMTLDEIRSVDAGVKKDAKFTGEQVPTLLEVIRDLPQDLLLFLEIKAGSHFYPDIEEQLIELFRQESIMHRVQVSSFDHHALKKLHELAPDLQLGMLYSCNLLDPVGLAQQCGANALHPAWPWVTHKLVEAAHAAGLKVNTWTCNAPMAIANVDAAGVDGIMSDFPDRVQ